MMLKNKKKSGPDVKIQVQTLQVLCPKGGDSKAVNAVMSSLPKMSAVSPLRVQVNVVSVSLQR